MKNEVYSWRISSELKGSLQDAARRENASISELLERIVVAWVEQSRINRGEDADEQRRLHRAASRTFGRIAGGDPGRSRRVRQEVQARLRRLHARQRPD